MEYMVRFATTTIIAFIPVGQQNRQEGMIVQTAVSAATCATHVAEEGGGWIHLVGFGLIWSASAGADTGRPDLHQ